MFIVKCYYRSYKSLSHAHQLQYLYKTASCVMSLCFQPKLFQILPWCLEYDNLVLIFKSYYNSYNSSVCLHVTYIQHNKNNDVRQVQTFFAACSTHYVFIWNLLLLSHVAKMQIKCINCNSVVWEVLEYLRG